MIASAALSFALAIVGAVPAATGDRPVPNALVVDGDRTSATVRQDYTRSRPVAVPRKLPGIPDWRCTRTPARVTCALNVSTHVLSASGTYRATPRTSSFRVRVVRARAAR